MGKSSLIMVLGFMVVFGSIRYRLYQKSLDATDNYIDDYERVAARNLANSAVNIALYELSSDKSWRAGLIDVSFSDGSFSATVEDATDDSTLAENQVRLTTTATIGNMSETVTVIANISEAVFPPGVKGSVTANATVTTTGNMTMDGRDHDEDGDLIPGQGTLGVSTVGALDRGGNSKVGGTDGGVDYAPSKPPDPSVYEEGATLGPTTPDSVMGGPDNGYSEGTLKAIAQAGTGGSQYVTNPSLLSFPLQGVTYVELPDGDTWNPIHFGASSGILVVHNSAGNAKMKNLNSGTFKGLIIADDLEHVHCTVIGAVVTLTSTPSGNCIGNGNGSILYSSAAIETHAEAASSGSGGGGSTSVASWWE